MRSSHLLAPCLAGRALGWVALVAAIAGLVQGSASASAQGSADYEAVVLADSPSSWWKLNETSGSVADDAVSTRDMTGSPAPTWGASGPGIGVPAAGFVPEQKMGNTLGFWSQHLDNFSVEVWVQRAAADPCLSGLGEIVGLGNFLRAGATGWGLYYYWGGVCSSDPIRVRLAVNTTDVIVGPELTIGTWYHLVVTRSNGLWTMYVNGAAVGSSSLGVPTASSLLWLGQDHWGPFSGFYLNGSLSHAAFYDHVLSAQRVLAHYEAMPKPPPGAQLLGAPGGSFAVNPTNAEAEPVTTATGNYYTSVTDLTLPGIGVPFAFTRSYNSADATGGALGPGWTHAYNASLTVLGNGDVVARAGDGQQLHFTLQGGSFVGDSGARASLSPVAGGYELVTFDQLHYRFDTAGKLTSLKDRNSQGLSFSYDGGGQLQTITDSVGRQVGVTFVAGLLSRVTLPDGRYVEYGYASGRLTSVRDARGYTTAYTYDAGGRLETIVDQRSHTIVRNVYDPVSGRVTDQYDALNNHATFAWNAQTQTSTFTDGRGKQWKDVYASGVLQKQIDPLNNTTQFEYDDDLNVKKVTDARNNATTMTFDGKGNLLTWTAPPPLSYEEVWTYNAFNDPLTYKDGRTNTTEYGYDTDGNLTSVTRPDPDGGGPLARPQTVYGRDPAGTGLLTSITDPRGKQTTFSYTTGDLTEIRTQLGHRTTLCYDGSGRMIGLVDPRGTQSCALPNDYRWSYTYNEANQLRTQTSPLGHGTELDYDAAGNLLFRNDANLHQTSYGYDDANRLTSVTAPDPDGGGPLTTPVTQYGYDEVGNLASRTDANQHQTTYQYDDASRLNRVTAPGNRIWTYGYDPNGNLNQVVDGNGNATQTAGDGQTTYGYDQLNRLSSIDYSDTTPDATFGYDPNSNRTLTTDGAGQEPRVYDTLDRLTSVTRGSNVFSYVYDLLNLTQATYPGAPAVTYAYDDDERLQSAGPAGQVTTYGYDEAANLKTTTLPSGNGYVETRSYDRAGRLVDVENKKGATTLSRFAITPDPVGNPLSVVRTGALAQTQTYGYDDMDRLGSVCFQAGTCPGPSDPFIRWTYDGVGNRLTETRPAGTTSYTYNVADELTQAGSTAYTYDQNGNLLSAGARTFAYDLANRLKTTTLASTTTTYTYDGGGKRLQASTGTQASKKTNFLWDVNQGLPQIALERDGNNALVRRYSYGQRRISMSTSSATSYYLHDGLGSVANLTSATGATQWTWSYEAYGLTRTETKASGSQPDNSMRFTGEYLDPTGLYHLRARQYDPSIGRFTSRDPRPRLQAKPYMSSYIYADDRPIVLTDPSGMASTPSDTCGSIACFGAHVFHKTTCIVRRHPIETSIAVVLAAGSVATLGVSGAALLGYLPSAGAFAGLATTEGGLHATGTLIASGALLGGGAAASGYAANRGC